MVKYRLLNREEKDENINGAENNKIRKKKRI